MPQDTPNNMSPFTALFGDTLQTKDGTVSTNDALSSKRAVGIYFSAHWCPPCRGFTPKLAESYTNHYKTLGMEIVFVSSDRDEAAFQSYHAEQPWLALPYSARDVKAQLSKKFKVSGIPSFVILDGVTGETITKDGREAVSEDPEGKQFPWKPPTFWEALGTEFLSGTEGETVDIAEVKVRSKYIGLYFSAHWCPPCRSFTPTLVEAYEQHLKAKDLEIIFVSSDRDQKAFSEYFGTMPWLAIPNGDKRKGQLSKIFEVSGIPSFVLIDVATGATITDNARSNVSSDPEGKDFPWHPKALNNVSSGEGIDKVNEEMAICVLLDGCSETAVKAAVEVLEPLAEASKAKGDELLWLYAPKTEGPVEQIRKLTKLTSSDKPQMVLLDIPDEGGFYTSQTSEISAETVTAFLAAYKAKELERQQLG